MVRNPGKASPSPVRHPHWYLPTPKYLRLWHSERSLHPSKGIGDGVVCQK
ncbi:hypothetical protein VB733_21505 [Calothrix sp. UHCC 0171]|nr:hypothetical protein [Calothrix sp. UHCC 0171]MEA5573648.1 hypothetical protein [Calothrix sp. UHCC 0171]